MQRTETYYARCKLDNIAIDLLLIPLPFNKQAKKRWKVYFLYALKVLETETNIQQTINVNIHFSIILEVEAEVTNPEAKKVLTDVSVYGFVKENEAGNRSSFINNSLSHRFCIDCYCC